MLLQRLLTLTLLLASFNLSAQRYYFENISVDHGLPASKAYAVLQDSTGLVWVGTEGGLASYDGNSVSTFGSAHGLAENGARSLFLDRKGRLWVGHLGGGITILEDRTFTSITIAGLKLTSDVTGFAQDAQGSIWVSTYGQGVLKLGEVDIAAREALAEVFATPQRISINIPFILGLQDGTICILEDGGSAKHWDPSGKSFKPLEPSGLPEIAHFTSLFEDRKGNLWFSSLSSGAFKVDRTRNQVTSFDIASGLPSNFTTCFSEDLDGNIYIGTWDAGLARIESEGIQRFNPDNGLHSVAVRALALDREGNLLVATNDHGMDLYRGERFLTFNDEDGLLDPQVWAVMEDQDRRIWFGTNGGINILDPSNKSTARVKTLTAQQGDLTSNRVRCLKQDSRGHVWIGMES
ncbi:MAG: hypothetical protein JNM91_01255, partial [Flavobacteriales bacterium]|nr:hypothetical protein [Flavobacteriales bacterium]